VTGLSHSAMRKTVVVYAYVAGYVALDWISLIQPPGQSVALGITPWNPPAGLSFALLLRYGWRFMPAVLTALALASVLFHGLPTAPLTAFAAVLVVAVVYTAAADLLRSHAALSIRIDSHADLLRLLGVALVATMLVAISVVATYAASGALPWQDFTSAVLHFWVGDMIGIAVFTPFLLLIMEHGPRALAARRRNAAEPILQLASIGAGLWVIFGLESADHFEFSYVLFLPLIWIALRSGLSGAIWGILATQLGLMIAVQLKGFDAGVTAQFQLLMLAVAATGLLLGSVVDERRRAEAAARDSEAQLQAVVSTAPDAILTYDETGAITSANRAAEQMFFAGTRAPAGTNIQTLLPGLRTEDAAAASGELVARRRDESSFVAEIAVGEAPIRGSLLRVCVVRDITARKQAEQWLKEHEAELAHAARLTATSEMAAALAHELNQPLTALIGFARACQAVLERPQDATGHGKAAGLIDQAVRQALRAGEIIRSTREFVQRGDTRFTKVDISQIFKAVSDLARSEMALNRVNVVIRFEKTTPPVFADAIQIEQVLLNLMRNSIEAMARSGAEFREIALSAAPQPGDPRFVEIVVRDSGPGIATEMAERLFKPFATTKDTGMGLGLSISRSIIETHGGQIRAVATPPGRGAEMRFTLPVFSDDPSQS
jgi:PAS domain S-box-containing protein